MQTPQRLYDEINDALVEITGNEEEKAETQQESRGLAAKMNQHKTGILATLWHHILHRFHVNSQALQSADQDLNSAVAIYESLVDFIGKQHARFEEFEAEGKKLSQCDQYVGEEKQVCKQNRCYNEPGSAPELPQTPVNKFHTDTFLVIIDRIDAELRKRLGACTGIAARFGFLQKLKDLSVEEVVESAKILQEEYPTDLEASLSDELVQFSSFLRTDFAMKSLDVTTASATSSQAINDTSSDKSDDEDDLKDDYVTLNVDSLELQMYRLLLENNLETAFQNILITLRIYNPGKNIWRLFVNFTKIHYKVLKSHIST